MADQEQLTIVVEAVNKASEQLKQIEKDLGGVSKAVGAQDVAAKSASMGFGTLVAGVTAGSIVAKIAEGAFTMLTGAIKTMATSFMDFTKYAALVDQYGIAMHIVANNAGITATQVDKVRDSVVDQNITTAAANQLMRDLIRNQLDYTKATDLAAAAQNIAAATGLSSSETLENINFAITSGIPWRLKDLGLTASMNEIYDKFGATINKTSQDLTEYEKRQAVMNYVLSEGVKYQGAYGAAMQNASKLMGSTRDRLKEISYDVGAIFEPAFASVMKTVYSFVNGIVVWAEQNRGKLTTIANQVGDFAKSVINSVSNFFENNKAIFASVLNFIIGVSLLVTGKLRELWNTIQIIGNGFQFFINTLVAGGTQIAQALKGDFAGMVQTGKDWLDNSAKIQGDFIGNMKDLGDANSQVTNAMSFDLQKWWKDVASTDSSGWEDKLKKFDKGGTQLTQAQKDKMATMLKDIQKENRDYQQAVEKRARDFESSFDELIITHRDAIKKLTDDLATENKDYQKKVADLVSGYDQAMKDMKKSHQDKTDSILANMEEEKKKTLEDIEAINEKYGESMGLVEQEGSDRIGNLQVQLDQELALGDKANAEKVAALKAMIAYEKDGLTTSLDDQAAKRDEEIDDVNSTLTDKLAVLQKELDDENATYEEALAERKAQYEQDVADAKASYEEKRSALQTELDTETTIRNKYADDFARIGDRIALDDITKAINSYNEQKAEAELQHQDRLTDIQANGFSEGKATIDSFAAGVNAATPALKVKFDQIKSDIYSIADSISNLGGNNAGGNFNIPWNTPIGIGSNTPYGATGGIFSKPTIVGEAGAEVVLPLSFPKQMAQIMKSAGLGGNKGGQVNQTFYVTVNNPMDVDVLMERAGFAMKNQGGLS